MYRSRLAFALATAALAAILMPSSLTAQITFQRTYGGTGWDQGCSVQMTRDGGYIVAGATLTFGAGYTDVYLVKTDVAGNMLWTKTYGGPNYEYSFSVQQAADGGYIIAGYTESFGAGQEDIYLVRTDSNGDTLWTKTFGGAHYDEGLSVLQTFDGSFIVAGWTECFGAGGGDVWLIKANANGDTLWTRTFGGTSDDWGRSVQQTADSGFIITGSTGSYGAGQGDVWLIKTDANGDTMWTRTFGSTSDDGGSSVQQTADGGYIVAGSTESFGAGDRDLYLVKTNAGGDTIWTRTVDGAANCDGYSVQQTSDGGYIVAGATWPTGAVFTDLYLVKTNANGDTQWSRTYGGTYSDYGWSVQQTPDGGYIIGGETDSYGAGSADVYLIKTDSLGEVAVAEPKTSPTRAPALALTCEPSPSSGTTRISFKPQTSSSKPLTLRVHDALGTLVLSQPVRASSFIFHPSSLPSGTYFLRLDAGSHHATARMVLQR